MKKQYIQPSMKAYAVNAQQILAGSETIGKGNGEQPTVADGRGSRSLWDDED